LKIFRGKLREQLFTRYRRDLKEGVLTVDQAHKLLRKLQKAFEKARRTNRRVDINGQDGTWGEAEIEDQILALKRALDMVE
jgi:hypothetical protein